MSLLTPLLSQVQKQASTLSIEPFVIDFCDVWVVIHAYVSQERIKKITKTKMIATKLKETVTIPFYEKYNSHPYVDSSTAWMNPHAALCLYWQGGRVLFPLKLITYELANRKGDLLNNYLEALLAGTIPGTAQALFNFLILFFGRVDIPHSWTYDFLARIRFLRKHFPDLLLLYSFDQPSLSRWNLSLHDTYNQTSIG